MVRVSLFYGNFRSAEGYLRIKPGLNRVECILFNRGRQEYMRINVSRGEPLPPAFRVRHSRSLLDEPPTRLLNLLRKSPATPFLRQSIDSAVAQYNAGKFSQPVGSKQELFRGPENCPVVVDAYGLVRRVGSTVHAQGISLEVYAPEDEGLQYPCTLALGSDKGAGLGAVYKDVDDMIGSFQRDETRKDLRIDLLLHFEREWKKKKSS